MISGQKKFLINGKKLFPFSFFPFTSHLHVLIFAFCLLTFYFSLPASLYASVTRTISGTTCEPVVTLTVTPESGTSAWAYEETVHSLQASSITGSGAWLTDSGVIRWGTFLNSTPQSFSYTLTGSDGTYSICGTESQDGADTDTETTDITIDCTPQLDQVETPVFDPPDGSDIPVTVSITTTTVGATIYYTVNGTIPTTSSDIYTVPINIDDRAILQAFAVKAGIEDSEICMAVYNRPYVPPAQVLERSVSGTSCVPVVSIAVTPTSGTSAYAIKEIIPPGVTPQNVSNSGVWDQETSTIRWGTFLDDSTRTLTYELTGPDADYPLSGTGSFDGRNQDIGGNTQVTIDCIPEQAATPVLDPVSGTRTPVTVTMTTATDGAEIRYTTDGTEPDESSILYTAPVLLYIEATVKAKAFKAGLAPSDTAQAYYLEAVRPKAIIVAGGGPFEGNSLWPATRHVSNYAYRALLYQGYAKEDIQFLSPDLTIDVDGNGQLDDIDAAATRANLQQAITTWASNAEDLILYFTDHGGNKTFMLGQDDILDAADLDAWLDTLQATMTGRVIVIYDACQSGTFLPEMIPPVDRERIIITSASNEPALFLEGGVLSFSYQFWASVFYEGKLYDAYLNGSRLMKGDQIPLLDADSDGIANEKADKLLISNILIGRGAMAASTPPDIQSVSGEQVLTGETSATVWADDITSLDPIIRVWAVVMPPDYHPGEADIPITDLPSLEMTDPESDGKYEGTYTEFTLHGTYRLMVYAKDSQGVISLPQQTTVVQDGGVIPPNNIPVAQNMSLNTTEDVSIQGTMSASDADNDTLNFIIVEDGASGTVTVTDVNTGAFLYQPHADENGTDSFTFKVNDGTTDSNIATVSITIDPVEDVPQALDMNIMVVQNGSVSDNLEAVDGDEDPVTFAIASQPSHGNVDLTNAATGAFTYTPSTDYYGPDSFTFTADDGKGTSPEATVSITVERGYNNPPTAPGSSASTQEDTPCSGTLQGSDPDGDPITYILVSAPVKGDVELTNPATGAFTYTPHDDLNGEDAFTYKVTDGWAESDTATCTVTITPVNDAPVATDGSLTVTAVSGTGGVLTATDAENDPLTYSIVSNGQMGQAVITNTSTGTFTYTPDSTENGTDIFTFVVNDGEFESTAAGISVNIRIPQAEIIRTLTGDGCSVDVSVDVTPVATVKAYAVEETIPEGMSPANINENGVWDEESRTIRWGVFTGNTPRTLTYTLTGDDGDYTISGTGSFDGWDQDVTGDSQATIACGAQRVATPVFDPAAGTRVPVDVTFTSATTDAEIRYTTDGTSPTPSSQLFTTTPLHFEEPVTIKARAYKDGMYESQIAEAYYLPTHSHKVIIVAGGDTGNYLWPATKLVSEYAYKALLYQGYAREDIMFLSAVTNVDVDGNGVLDDIDGLAGSSALENAIKTWALDAESLLIYLTDHGGDSTFQLSPGDILSATDLDSWLDTLQGSMDGMVMVVSDSCRSGSFLQHLDPPTDTERIVITSASDESAWFLWGGRLSFSYQFWASIFGNANIYDAYYNGKRMMHEFQTALLDADGDGIAGENEDWLAAKDILIGRGAVAAALPPEIGHVSLPQVLETDTSATLSAWDITALNDIERVWAVIIPPGYAPASPDEPVTEMTEIDLVDSNGDGTYEGTYGGFSSGGTYNIVVYARDSEGLFSEPMETTVLKDEHKGEDDNDGDGIINSLDPDDDNDGMPDAWERQYGGWLDPYLNDAADDPDGDRCRNFLEYVRGTDPTDPDSHPTKAMPWLMLLLDDDGDGDGMPDDWESSNGLNPHVYDAGEDPDGDGLTNVEEYQHSTDPQEPDTEGDGMLDGWEVGYNLNPLLDDAGGDPDVDRWTNLEEYNGGTDPTDPDSHPPYAMPWLMLLLDD
jgi:Big-like domain-containing protein/chitobiase/beta-hexosaminidase-like protein/peptidase C13-like protein